MSDVRIVSSGDVRLGMRQAGTGDPLVFLHGALTDAAQARAMTACLTTRRTVTYDARGRGDSTRTLPSPDDHSLDRLVDDLVAVLDAVGDVGPVTVGGASLGAAVSLAFALRAPDRLDTLVQVAPAFSGPAPDGADGFLGFVAETVDQGGFDALRERLDDGWGPEISRWETLFEAPTLVAFCRAVARLEPIRSLDELERVTVPTLVVGWPGDPLHPLELAEAYADRLPDSTLVELPVPRDEASLYAGVCEALRGWLG